MQDCYFERCSCSDSETNIQGCGGCMYVVLSGSDSTFSVSGSHFIGNSATSGNNAYFTCSNVTAQLPKSAFAIDSRYLIEKEWMVLEGSSTTA